MRSKPPNGPTKSNNDVELKKSNGTPKKPQFQAKSIQECIDRITKARQVLFLVY